MAVVKFPMGTAIVLRGVGKMTESPFVGCCWSMPLRRWPQRCSGTEREAAHKKELYCSSSDVALVSRRGPAWRCCVLAAKVSRSSIAADLTLPQRWMRSWAWSRMRRYLT